jgi:hypothetical protein
VAVDLDKNDAGTWTGTSGTSFTFTPVGTPRGIVLFFLHPGKTGTGYITAVTYGGATMAKQEAHCDFGQHAAGSSWFLGSLSGLSGPQTVVVTANSISGITNRWYGYSVTASSDTAAVQSKTDDQNAALVAQGVDLSGATGKRFVAAMSGADNYTSLTTAGNTTQDYNTNTVDENTNPICFVVGHETSTSSGNTAVGWTYSTADRWFTMGVGVYESVTQTTQTISSKFKVVWNTTTQTISQKFAVVTPTTKTISSKFSVRVSTTKTIASLFSVILTSTQKSISSLFRVTAQATTTKAISSLFRVSATSQQNRSIGGKFKTLELVPPNVWVQRPDPTQTLYGGLTGFFEDRGWGRLLYDLRVGKILFMDGYRENTGTYSGNNIYANSIWEYDWVANTLRLLKVNNWYRDVVAGQTKPLPANVTDPTPFDRHPYECIAYSVTKDKIYIWAGANNSMTPSNPPDNAVGNTWVLDVPGVRATPGLVNAWREVAQPFDGVNPMTVYEQSMDIDRGGGAQPLSIVLCGAHPSQYHDGVKTYKFNLNTEAWSIFVSDPNTPPAKFGHTTCYDPIRRYMWQFGGGYAPYPTAGDELWRLDCFTGVWVQIPKVASWPLKRRFACIAYDTRNDVIVMWGGQDDGVSPKVYYNDTWMFDPQSQVWTQLTIASPPVADSTHYSTSDTMTYDELNNVYVLKFSGKFYVMRYNPPKTTQTIGGKFSVSVTTSAKTIGGKFLVYVPPISGSSLSVQEILPSGISGLTRTAGHVMAGIPLAESDNITSVNQLGLSGVSAGQFRALKTHPSGKLKSVLVDFQLDVTAGAANTSVTLMAGSGNFGGPSMVTNVGTYWQISTGAALFQVYKSGFRFLDLVQVGATTVLSSPSSGSTANEGIVVVDGATRYSSLNGVCVTTLEEDGPVRACIRIDGDLRSSGGTIKCDYVCRLHFFKGKAHVKASVTIKNAKADTSPVNRRTTFTFTSMEVAMKLVSGTYSNFVTKTSLGTDTITLSGSDKGYVFQAYTARNSSDGVYANTDGHYSYPPWDYANQKGIETGKVGGTKTRTLTGNTADWAEGWAALETSGGQGVTAGLRNMAAMYPASIEGGVTGDIKVQMFSPENSQTGLKFGWGPYETREMIFDFHTSTPSSRSTVPYELDYPLFARAPLQQYADAGWFFGETHLVTEAEQTTFFSNYGGTTPSLANITPYIWRFHFWSDGGGHNQMDFALNDLLDFARTGRGGFMIQGYWNSMYKADQAIVHSDGFDWAANQINFGDAGGNIGTWLNSGCFNGYPIDPMFGHQHWISVPIAYLFTGNELLNDAVTEFGEWKYGFADGTSPNYFNPLGPFSDIVDTIGDQRIWSRYLRDFALLYDWTRNARYQTNWQLMIDNILSSGEGGSGALNPAGKSVTRGFMWMNHGSADVGNIRHVADFFGAQIHFEAVYECLRLLREASDSRAEAVEAYLHGLADFFFNEVYLTKNAGTAAGDFGYAYSYKLDAYNDPASSGEASTPTYLRPISAGRMLEFAYRYTGDVKYLARFGKMMIGDIAYVATRTPSDYPTQAAMWADLNRPQTGWVKMTLTSIVYTGNGTYQLKWHTPTGGTRYQVRYAYTPINGIVPWLNFNQATRVFQFNPGGYTPWFSATRYPNPQPTTSGSSQILIMTGLDQNQVPAVFEVRVDTSTTTTQEFTRTQNIAGGFDVKASTTQTISSRFSVALAGSPVRIISSKFAVRASTTKTIGGLFATRIMSTYNIASSFLVQALVGGKTISGKFKVVPPKGKEKHKPHTSSATELSSPS